MNTGHNAYRETTTMGMSQLDLILTVYRGTIGLLDQAMQDFEAGNNESGRLTCEKVRKCVVHLYTTLDMEKGKDIARHLGQLYAFMIQQIDVAMASHATDILKGVRDNLSTIKEGWEGLKEQDTSLSSATAGHLETGKNEADIAEKKPDMPAETKHVTFSA
jgi:flagellar protein FliS